MRSGAQRATASDIVAGLSDAGLTVFYDNEQLHMLLGEDGEISLQILYSTEARFYVVLVSKDYDRSSWTQLELEAIQARKILDTSGVLNPVTVGQYRPKWLSPDRIYLDLRNHEVQELVEILRRKASATPVVGTSELRGTPDGYQVLLS